jgi:hypothetical protein
MLTWDEEFDDNNNPEYEASSRFLAADDRLSYRIRQVHRMGRLRWSLDKSDHELNGVEFADAEFDTLDEAKEAADLYDRDGEPSKSLGELLYECMHGDDRPMQWGGDWERSQRTQRYETAAAAFKSVIEERTP